MGMRTFSKSSSIVWYLLGLALGLPVGGAEHNTLTPSQQAAGWRLLFDGRTTQGWRGYKKSTFPEQGWVVRDGWLVKEANVRGGDIISVDQFTDFELEWEWKISPRGNNGVKYFITEAGGGATGHEYQMMDDLGKTGKGSTGSFYDVLPPALEKPMKPAGGINQSRIVVRGDHVEHWLNGARILEYECGSPAVMAAVAQSKFRNIEGFGRKIDGHILLTDHRDECWFRNIRIRILPAARSAGRRPEATVVE
jgi:hypothetical protein